MTVYRSGELVFPVRAMRKKRTHIGYRTRPSVWILLVQLHIRCKTHGVGQGLDFFKPCRSVILRVILLPETGQSGLDRPGRKFPGKWRVCAEKRVIKETHIRFGIFPGCEVFSGLLTAPAHGEDGGGVRRSADKACPNSGSYSCAYARTCWKTSWADMVEITFFETSQSLA